MRVSVYSDANRKKTFSLIIFFLTTIIKKNNFFYNLKKGKYISIPWCAYSVIHIIYCIIQAVKHYMNCIYDS